MPRTKPRLLAFQPEAFLLPTEMGAQEERVQLEAMESWLWACGV